MKSRIDPEGTRLPIKLDATSNGEFVPRPLDNVNVAANTLAHDQASINARHSGLSRREFLVSTCGAASTLLAFNAANAAAGATNCPRRPRSIRRLRPTSLKAGNSYSMSRAIT